MAGLGLGASVIVLFDRAVLGVLVHIIGVAVVCCDAQYSTGLLHRLLYASDLQVHGLHGADHCVEYTGVPHHVAVGEVEPYMLVPAALYSFDNCIGNLGTLHPGPLFKGDNVALYLYVIL